MSSKSQFILIALMIIAGEFLPATCFATTTYIYNLPPVDLGVVDSTTLNGCVPTFDETQAPGGPLVIPCFAINLVPANFPNGQPGNFQVSENTTLTNSNGTYYVAVNFTGTYALPVTVDLRYQILGVEYAPPGAKSTVTYATSTTLGTSTTNSESFNQNFSETLGDNFCFSTSCSNNSNGPVGFSLGITGSFSYGYTSTDGTTVAITEQTSSAHTIPGPAASLNGLPIDGVDHDYDEIVVWLNPEENMQMLGSTTAQWTGYSNNPADENGPDIIRLSVQELKAVIADPNYFNKNPGLDLAGSVSRSWDANLGALTTADYQTILAADPFWAGSFQSTKLSSGAYHEIWAGSAYSPYQDQSAPCATNPGITCPRFSDTGTEVQYQPGTGQQQAGFSTQTTNSSNSMNSYSYSTAATVTAAGGFLFNANLKINGQFTTTDSQSSTDTSGDGSADTLTIVSPAVADMYCGPINYEVWKDNIYGTYVLFPANDPCAQTNNMTPIYSLLLH